MANFHLLFLALKIENRILISLLLGAVLSSSTKAERATTLQSKKMAAQTRGCKTCCHSATTFPSALLVDRAPPRPIGGSVADVRSVILADAIANKVNHLTNYSARHGWLI